MRRKLNSSRRDARRARLNLRLLREEALSLSCGSFGGGQRPTARQVLDRARLFERALAVPYSQGGLNWHQAQITLHRACWSLRQRKTTTATILRRAALYVAFVLKG